MHSSPAPPGAGWLVQSAGGIEGTEPPVSPRVPETAEQQLAPSLPSFSKSITCVHSASSDTEQVWGQRKSPNPTQRGQVIPQVLAGYRASASTSREKVARQCVMEGNIGLKRVAPPGSQTQLQGVT